MLDKITKIAKLAHNNQTRNDGITPYIVHPLRVGDSVKDYGFDYVATAYLHDVIEDTSVTITDLIKEGVPKIVINAVEAITKHDHEDYRDYLSRVRFNSIACVVKCADIVDNLLDMPSASQRRRYISSLLYLAE